MERATCDDAVGVDRLEESKRREDEVSSGTDVILEQSRSSSKRSSCGRSVRISRDTKNDRSSRNAEFGKPCSESICPVCTR